MIEPIETSALFKGCVLGVFEKKSNEEKQEEGHREREN